MLLSLRNDHKEHLSLLLKQPTQVIVDFCKLAIDFLQNGCNMKLYINASKKLNVEVDVVQNCIYGLVNLLLLSCKHKLSEIDFRDSVLTLGFTQEQQLILSKFYMSRLNDICQLLEKLSVNESHYYDLDWRFEILVSSRSLLHQVTPLISMDLMIRPKSDNVNDELDNLEHIKLQTDPNNLLHLAEELESALNESRTRHARRIQRAFANS